MQEYDNNLYNEIYNSNNTKTFSFATILSRPTFNKEEITLKDNNFSIIFSAYNYVYALHLYNSFLEQKNKKFSLNKNSMTLNNMVMLPEEEISTNKINIKMLSPIITRNRNQETLKDMYYSYEREEFVECLKMNIKNQLKKENIDLSTLDGFEINPIQAKKIVIPVYEKMIESSIGIFCLEGKKELLNYLYKAGIGSKKAMGFGLFEII